MDNEDKKQFTIRIDKKLYDKIVILGEKEKRKVSPQIEYMLMKYIEIKEG